MRSRLPLGLALLLIVISLVAAGCGDDAKDASPEAQPATAATAQTGSTGASGSTSDSADSRAKSALATCKSAAERLPDEHVEQAKKKCEDAYDNIKDATKKIDEKTKDAVAGCKKAAESINDADVKQRAIDACESLD